MNRRGKRLLADLDQEIREHIELAIKENLDRGMAPDEARYAALRKFGSVTRAKEDAREVWSIVWVEQLGQDIRFAFRQLRKSPVFTVVAILTLALGVGATITMFSIVYHVSFDALPYRDFGRYVVFEFHNTADVGGWKGRNFFTPDEARAFREQNHVFEDVIVHNGYHVIYDNGKLIHHWPRGEEVTTNAFDFLGVAPLLGRTFSQFDASQSAPPVFIMNYRLWQSDFQGNPNILNTVFILDGKPRILVGIMPQRFNLFGASFWIPMSDTQATGSILGRLKPGVSLQAVATDLDLITHRLQKTAPPGWIPADFRIVPHTLLDSFIGGFRKTAYALLGAVLLLHLIACANIAGLLFARATIREREMVMRAALGAGRVRLVRQLLAESLVFASFGSIAGCLLAYFTLKVVVALIPTGVLPEEVVIRIDTPILLTAVALTLLTTVLSGLAPALHIIRTDLQPALTSSGKSFDTGFTHGKLRAILVAGEVALSIVLLVGAGLLMRSFFILTHADFGFDPHNVLYFRLALPPAYNSDVDTTRERRNALTRELLERLHTLPGVTAVSESMLEPPLRYDWSDTILPGKPHTERWETRFEVCSEGYFQLLGFPLLRGRFFSSEDIAALRKVMVVNEMFARQYFPSEDPIGHKVKLEVLDRPFLDAPHDTYFEIIGIVGNHKVRDDQTQSWRAFPETYIPYSVQGFSYRTYMVRTAIDPQALLKTIDQDVRAIDPNIEVATSGTLDGSLQEFYRRPQFELFILSAFATVGMLLVSVGIFGMVAYAVSHRTHEIGIRTAIGASPKEILSMVLNASIRPVGAGVAIGLFASQALSRYLASEVSGVSLLDPLTYLLVSAAVLAVGLLAAYIPARRATQVDPIIALRHE